MMDQEDTKFRETHLPPLRLYKRQAVNHPHDRIYIQIDTGMDPDAEFLHDFLEIFTSDLSFKMNGENNVYNFFGAKEDMQWSLRTIRRKFPQVIIEDCDISFYHSENPHRQHMYL